MPVNEERMRRMMDFGLTEYQARVYLTMLDLGVAAASQIPARSGVPRTRIYSTMNQLHEKGLIKIILENPLKYEVAPFSEYLAEKVTDLRQEAADLEAQMEGLSREFAIRGTVEPEERGRFEALYGRKSVRERLNRMYDGATREIISIGTSKSPARIVNSRLEDLREKASSGISLRYAFPLDAENMAHVKVLSEYAEVRDIEMNIPIFFLVVDSSEMLMCHPIPNDESFYRGDDISIRTDDPAIVGAFKAIAESIWESGVDPSDVGYTRPILHSAVKYVDLLSDSDGVLRGFAREIGRQLAPNFKERTAPALLDEITQFFREKDLGEVTVLSEDPLTIQVEAPRGPDASSGGRTPGGFAEAILQSILAENLGIQSSLKDVLHPGQKGDEYSLVVDSEAS